MEYAETRSRAAAPLHGIDLAHDESGDGGTT
jgi:hypothetical protein